MDLTIGLFSSVAQARPRSPSQLELAWSFYLHVLVTFHILNETLVSGCEFVKAVSGFNCRLCKTFIRCGNDVINHIKGKKHQINYKVIIIILTIIIIETVCFVQKFERSLVD